METTNVYTCGTNRLRLVQSPPERTSPDVGRAPAAAASPSGGVALPLVTIVGHAANGS
jgi:hypothetical protein